MKAHVNEIVNEATAYLVALSEHQGTKTLHGDNETVTVSGGPSTDYDPADLREALEAAGCPQDRIDAAVGWKSRTRSTGGVAATRGANPRLPGRDRACRARSRTAVPRQPGTEEEQRMSENATLELALRKAPEAVMLTPPQIMVIAQTEFVPKSMRGNVPKVLACIARVARWGSRT
jgi:hypothetical protein